VADRGGQSPAKEPARPGAIERILFSRVELWVIAVLLLLGCLLAIGFGAAVLDAERGDFRFGPVSRAALAVAEIPRTAKQLLTRDADLLVSNSYRDRGKPTGWSFPSDRMTGPDGYILLSRYDGTEMRNKVELVSLPSMRTVHSWTPVASDLLKDVTHISRFAEYTNWDNSRFREIHPWIEENGDLIIKDMDSPLLRIDPCGRRLWILQDAAYHHSTEADAEGNLWVPSVAERPTLAKVDDRFREEMISKVSPSGRVLFRRSVAQILIRHGYANWLFTIPDDDPIHLNDIEPVLADGPYWKKGDLFLSMRNVSAVMLYRPSTDSIVWIKRGPWIAQHDVDVLDDHRIGIYNNAVEERSRANPYFSGPSQVEVYDFATGKISLPLKDIMTRNEFRTWVEGLFTQLPDGSTLIEDPTEARLVIFRQDGTAAAQYVNRAKDGGLYHLGWSRYIDKPKGDLILRNLRKVKCDA
jgi:hypothetical protein